MQFEVPQFIEIEDKIFGPLTWRQFVYLAGGGGIAVVLFLVAPFILFVLIGLPIAGLAVTLAFFPVNNQPFSRLLESMYNYFTGHKLYLWQQHREIVHNNPLETIPATSIKKEKGIEKKRNISSLARSLELKAIQKNS
jgi:hypothetical protein